MTKVLLAVVGALALCIGGLVLVVAENREPEQQAVDNLLAEQLTLEIARAEGRLDLADVTPFDWDTLLIVETGTDADTISAFLGEPWNGAENFRTGDLLVFVRAGRVARYADYRGEGRFAKVERPVARFAREDAVFDVGRDLVITPR